MKKLYVTELSFAGKGVVEKDQVIAQYGTNGWTADDIYVLLDYSQYLLSYSDRRTGNMVSINIIDRHALAQWLSVSDLIKYDKVNTVDEETVDFSYSGEDYHLVFLIREVLADFIIDTVENSLTNKSVALPSGIELY